MQERTHDLPGLEIRTLNSLALAIIAGRAPFTRPRSGPGTQVIDEPHVRRLLDGRGVQRLLEFDSSGAMLALSASDAAGPNPPEFEVTQVQLREGEEFPRLPKESADLIVSCMHMHWVSQG